MIKNHGTIESDVCINMLKRIMEKGGANCQSLLKGFACLFTIDCLNNEWDN